MYVSMSMDNPIPEVMKIMFDTVSAFANEVQYVTSIMYEHKIGGRVITGSKIDAGIHASKNSAALSFNATSDSDSTQSFSSTTSFRQSLSPSRIDGMRDVQPNDPSKFKGFCDKIRKNSDSVHRGDGQDKPTIKFGLDFYSASSSGTSTHLSAKIMQYLTLSGSTPSSSSCSTLNSIKICVIFDRVSDATGLDIHSFINPINLRFFSKIALYCFNCTITMIDTFLQRLPAYNWPKHQIKDMFVCVSSFL